MKITDDHMPKPITDKQKDGKRYIVFDEEYDPIEWTVARYHPVSEGMKDILGIDGNWYTETIEPRIINPTHYVEITYDVV